MKDTSIKRQQQMPINVLGFDCATDERSQVQEPEDSPPVPVPEAFRVQDEQSANWVLRHIAAAIAYKRHVKDWADAEVRRAEREEEWFRRRFASELERWTRQAVARLRGRKSIKLPAGTVGFRCEREKLVVDDEPALLEWAKENCPNAVIVVERLSKSALNDWFQSTGQVPDVGVHIEPRTERFYIG